MCILCLEGIASFFVLVLRVGCVGVDFPTCNYIISEINISYFEDTRVYYACMLLLG